MCDRVLIINFQQRRAERTDTRDVHGTAYKTNPTHPVEKVIKGSHTRPARRPRSALSRAGALEWSDLRRARRQSPSGRVHGLVWLGTTSSPRVARYYVLAARLRHKNYTRQQQHGGRGATQARSQYTVQGILTRPYLYSGGHCKGERSSRAGAGAASPASRPHLAPSCGGCYSPATALLQPCCGGGGGLRPELRRASDATCG